MGHGRFKRGWELTKRSWALLREHPSLMRFPVYGALAALIPLGLLLAPGLYLIDTERYVPGGVLAALGLYGAVFAAVYFGVALCAAADSLFRGGRDPAAEGGAVARSRIRQIAGWALVSAVVGTVLSVVESQRGIAQIVGTLIGAAWALITFLAVPVIAIEGVGPIDAVRRSTRLFKERWAGQVTGNVAIGGIIGLLAILPSILLIAAGVYLWINDPNGDDIALGAVLAGVGIVVLTIASLVQRALRGVFGVALYRFAADGRATGGFTTDQLEAAVAPRSR